MKITQMALTAAALAAAGPLAAQDAINTVCDGLPEQVHDECVVVAQAVDAAHPQLGILMAGGNPTLGTASTGGVRLGIVPRVSLTGRVNVVAARLPDIRDTDRGEDLQRRVLAPAVGATVSVGLTEGFGVAPMIGGFGAIDLLGSVSVLPLSLVEDFGDNAFSWGAGARVGLIRESFVTPGVSVSLMYRNLGDVSFGDVCEGTEGPAPLPPRIPTAASARPRSRARAARSSSDSPTGARARRSASACWGWGSRRAWDTTASTRTRTSPSARRWRRGRARCTATVTWAWTTTAGRRS